MYISVALYRGKGHLHNTIVRGWTKSEYSHAELIMPDKTTITILPFDKQGLKRVPFAPEDREDWDFICVPAKPHQVEIIEKFYEQTKGQRYDWLGLIISQLLPYHVKHRNRWYCSEWISYALRLSGIVTKYYEKADASPAGLHDSLSLKGVKHNWFTNPQEHDHAGQDD